MQNAVDNLQHLAIGRHVVGVQKLRARNWCQFTVEDSLSNPIGAPVPFVPVVGPQRSIENCLELSLGVLGSERFRSTRGHIPHSDWRHAIHFVGLPSGGPRR